MTAPATRIRRPDLAGAGAPQRVRRAAPTGAGLVRGLEPAGGKAGARPGRYSEPDQPRWAAPPRVLAHDQAEVDEMGLRLLSLLGEAGRSRTWLAAGPAAETRVARRLTDRPVEEIGPGVTDLVRLVSLRDPSLLTPTQLVAGRPTWLARRYSDGVPLRRLLMLVSLTAAQLLAVGRDAASGLAVLHAAGLTHGSVHGGNVIVGLDGLARLCDAGIALVPGGAEGRRRDVADLLSLLESARAGRHPLLRARPPLSGWPHLQALLRAGGSPPAAAEWDPERLLEALCAAAGETAPRVRRELSALVLRVRPRGAVLQTRGADPVR
jgi:hypothetical protein